MSADHGSQNDESIVNQSGDTLLLTDEHINTYAEILRREDSTPAQVTPGSDTRESYIGRGRRLTDFERAHFGVDNITPGRPCTAYFSAGFFVDSKAVFDKLTELEIPRESVLCLQKRPSRDMLITFVDEETKNKFVSCVAVRFRDSTAVIDDEDMPLTFLNIYDAPHELSDQALTLRLSKYCSVFSTRRGKFPKSQVYNGLRHYRVRIKEPLPSYLRFGKFLVRLSHDGQQHTCRRCNRAGHFANECQHTVCFNCEDLGHQARDCEFPTLCCICKASDHIARRCPFSWYQRPLVPIHPVNRRVPDLGPGGNVAAPADDLPPSSSRDPGPGGDVAAPASDPACEGSLCVDLPSISDSDLLAAASVPSQPVDVPSDDSPVPDVLDSQGFLWEDVIWGKNPEPNPEPNPPGPQSATDDDSMAYPDTEDSPAVLPADPPTVPSADPPVDPSAVPPTDSSAVSSNDPPVDQPSSSPADKPVKSRPSVASSRRKPAPLPPALEALSRRPTRPSLPVAGRSASTDPPPAPPDEGDEPEEMITQSSLKRKPETARKTDDPKKGKH